jgi:V/A-type H+-transporting ATPase subunit K
MGDLAAFGIAMAAAFTMLGTAFATAWAQKVIGGAAVGAMAEKPELFGKGLTMMVLPETIIIFGLVIGFLILGQLPAALEVPSP